MSEEAEVEAGPPGWLAELAGRTATGPRLPDGVQGFCIAFPNFTAVFVMRGAGQLVVSFDNLSVVRDRSLSRDTWGGSFFRERGWSTLGILPYAANWYRDPHLYAFLEGLRDRGFFAGFTRVALTGTSMGGYAAAAFSSLSPGATVAAFAPQSTLKKALVPWEKRFNRGRKEDWSGPYADGAEESAGAARVWLVHDPWVEADRAHVERFRAPNAIPLRAPWSGHRTVVFLRKAGILKDVMGGMVDGTLTPERFRDLYRKGRTLPWYVFGLFDEIIRRGRPDLAERVIAHHRKIGLHRIAEQLVRRRAGPVPDPEGEPDEAE